MEMQLTQEETLRVQDMQLTQEEELRVRDIKNRLHMYPETAWEEHRTAELIRQELRAIEGVELMDCPLPTAVLGRIAGAKPGKTIALRADIDAIRAREEWKSSCMSQVEGVSHVCGHDFHTAGLIGAACILSRMRESMSGDVILLFQPAEETTSGAGRLMETELFKSLNIDMIFGLHNRPEVKTGQVVVNPGPMMSAKRNFLLIIQGLGGHGSMPHKCIDPIVCAAAMIQSLQTIVSRNTSPQETLVLSIGSIHGGSCENLVVDRLEMTGSMRYFTRSVGERAVKRLEAIVKATAEAYECRAEIIYQEQVPAVINPPKMYEIARRAAVRAMGEEAVIQTAPSVASEDFALYMEKIPGFFYWLGVGREGEPCYAWHNAKFHTNDEALKHGAALLACSALEGQAALL